MSGDAHVPSLGELGTLAALALADCREILATRADETDEPATLSELALVSIAASLYRLQAVPARVDPPDVTDARLHDAFGLDHVRDPRPAGTRYAPPRAPWPGDPFGIDRDPDPPDPLDVLDPLESSAERYVRETDERRDT